MSEETYIAWCYYCDSEEEFSDGERCCVTCGTDLVVLADRYSLELMDEVYANWATYMADELKRLAQRVLRRGDQVKTGTNPVPKLNREVTAEVLAMAHGLYRKAGGEITLEELSVQVGLVKVEADASGGAE